MPPACRLVLPRVPRRRLEKRVLCSLRAFRVQRQTLVHVFLLTRLREYSRRVCYVLMPPAVDDVSLAPPPLCHARYHRQRSQGVVLVLLLFDKT